MRNKEAIVRELFQVRQQKSALEKVEKLLLEDVKTELDTDLNGTPDNKILFGNLELARIGGTNVTIKADLLLERGVSPDIIQYATATKTYFQYRVKELK